MVQQFGYTDGCIGCRFKRAGLKEPRNHTEDCRRIITRQLMETASMQRLLYGQEPIVEAPVDGYGPLVESDDDDAMVVDSDKESM